MTTQQRTKQAVVSAWLVGLVLGTSSLLAGPALGAAAGGPPGDNGDLKVHLPDTPFDDDRNEPKVCDFYLAGFNFDPGQEVLYGFREGPAFKGDVVLAGSFTVDADGNGHSGVLSLPDGQWKPYLNFTESNGTDNFKVFKVDCAPEEPPPPPGEDNPPPPAEENPPPPAGTGGVVVSTPPKVTPVVQPPFSGGGTVVTLDPPVTASAPDPQQLPRTGADTGEQGAAAAALLLAGAGALVAGRRRYQPRHLR